MFLIEDCPNLRPVILRAGKVYTGTSFFSKFLRDKTNYTHLDALCMTVFEEVKRAYDGSSPIENSPLFISAKTINQ